MLHAKRARSGMVAAVLLVAVVALALSLIRVAGDRERQIPSIRPITPDEIAPSVPLILAWEGGSPPFRAALLDENGDVRWRSGRLSEALVRVPEAVRDELEENRVYRWQVEGLDARGRPWRSERFVLRVRGRDEATPIRGRGASLAGPTDV